MSFEPVQSRVHYILKQVIFPRCKFHKRTHNLGKFILGCFNCRSLLQNLAQAQLFPDTIRLVNFRGSNLSWFGELRQFRGFIFLWCALIT